MPEEQNDPKINQRIQELEDSRARLEEKSTALLNILEDLEEERTRAEENEHRFRTLFENISDGIVVVNRNTEQISLANAAACQLLGYSADELSGLKFTDIHPIAENLSGSLYAQDGMGLETTSLIGKDGRSFPVEIRSSNLEIGGEQFAQHLFRDITERITAEADLKKRTEEISLLYTAGHQLASTLDLDVIFAEFEKIVSKMMDCIALIVSSYDSEDQMIRCLFAVQDGVKLDVSTFPAVPLAKEGRGTQSLVIRSGESMIIADYLAQRQTSKNYYYVTKDGIVGREIPENDQLSRSALIVPMKLEGKVTGTIQVFSYQTDAFSEDKLRFLEALAIQTAAAVHNASLYQHSQAEIDERRKVEQALRTSESQIRSSLAEKEVLIREIHHRVKNNLEVIISLADMQARLITDPTAVHSIRELQERVRTIALVHEDLYQSKNLANIHAGTYLMKLTDNLFQVFGSAGIDLHVEAADLALGVEMAVPFGLIVTELVTNALKHAFPGRDELKLINPKERPNRIDLCLSDVGQKYNLEVRDNGIGLPPDLDWRTTRSLGLRLVNRLAEQLHGSLEAIECQGTCFRLTFVGPDRETTGD